MPDHAQLSRRELLQRAALLGGALLLGGGLGAEEPTPAATATTPRQRDPKEKLRFGVIGVSGRGAGNLSGIAGVATVAALCDVDAQRLAGAAKSRPEAKTYRDYRELLAKAASDELDGVVISTPDHMHAPITLTALAQGLHVYCEKPLTRTVWEARRVAQAASAPGLATQMGNQGSSGSALRRAVDAVRAGVIGTVREIHLWTDRPTWRQGLDRPKASPAPAQLDWDLWLGVAPERPYADKYHPFGWRAWHDFGAGAIGDIACHAMNLPFHACDLTDPSEIEATYVSDTKPECYPRSATVRYAFPERGARKALELFWYEGGRRPAEDRIPAVVRTRGKLPGNGGIIIGDSGVIYCDDMYGAVNYLALTGEDKLMGLTNHQAVKALPPGLAKSAGHYQDLIIAARGGPQPLSNFVTAAKLTEVGILGCIAERFPGKRLQWDAAAMRFPNLPEADALLTPAYRPGFATVTPG